MNIVVLNDFSEDLADYIRRSVPQATFSFYLPEQLGAILAEVLAAAEVLYTTGPLPERSTVPRLKWVQVHSAGVDHIVGNPLFHAPGSETDGAVQLTTASGVHAINIAEYIVMMMLALAHKLPLAFHYSSRAEWGDRGLFMPRELHGATTGIIGYGAIGRQTAKLCRALGMRVYAMRRRAAEPQDGVTFFERGRLRDMLADCDYIALTLPLTAESRHLINADMLAAMKSTAFLVNIARGDIVDEAAMIAALQSGRLAGAALDVFSREPLPLDSPLWRMDNVILTPHIAGITPSYGRRAAELFVDNLQRYIAGNPLMNKVDFSRGY